MEEETKEPIHRHLARHALKKAADSYKNGDIDAHEFDSHIKRASNRLMESHMIAMPMAAMKAPRRKKKAY